MTDYDLALAVMEDDGNGSAITTSPAERDNDADREQYREAA